VDRVQTAGEPVKIVWRAEESRQEVLSAESAKTLTAMLSRVTDEQGTGVRAAIPGFQVAGKTGTSQKLVEVPLSNGNVSRVYSSDDLIVSFAGFVPAEDPAFVLLVIYDQPQGDVSGGVTAAPSFQRIAAKSLGILGVKPRRESTAVSGALQTGEKLFVGKSFQQVLEHIKTWDEDSRAKVELYGFGHAVKEEFKEDRIKVFFE
jgi:cell division protein FtsI (penicillin-binding protein 3)